MKKLLLITFLTVLLQVTVVYAADKPAPKQNEVKDNDDTIGREYMAGSFAIRNNDYDAAAKLYLQMLLKNPGDKLLLQNTYRAMMLAGNYEIAAKYANEYLKLEPDSINAKLILSIHQASKNNFIGASNTLQIVESSKSKKPIGVEQLVLPFVRSWILAGEGNYEAAIASLDPHDVGNIVSPTFVSLQQALIHSISGNNKLAGETFDTLLSEKGLLPYHLAKSAASFYETTGQWEKAGHIYVRYRASHPATPQFENAYERINNKVTNGLYIKTPKQGLAEVMKEASRLLLASEVYNEGLFYLRLALMLEPQDDEANILLAGVYEQAKDYEKAILIYNNIKADSDFYVGAQINKAENLYSMDKKPEAKKLLLGTAKNTRDDFIPLLTLADLQRRDNDYKDAIETYTRILDNPANKARNIWPLYFGRGMCFERIGKWKLAEEDFLKALQLSPEQPEVSNYLAYSWIEHNINLDKALNMLLKAAARRPEDPQILDSAGWALYKNKDYKNAVIFLEKATAYLPQDAVMNDHLGDIYWMLNRKDEARFQWQRSIKYGPAESSTKEQLESKIAKGL